MAPIRLLLVLLLACCGTAFVAPAPAADHVSASDGRKARQQAPKHTLVGKKQRGKASYYSHHLSGRKMADGTRLNPRSNAAASKTLPLGTKARVKNLDNGKSAMVEIKDRGPYVKGRIIDVTPRTAKQLGIEKDGVAPVEVEAVSPPKEGLGDTKQDRQRR